MSITEINLEILEDKKENNFLLKILKDNVLLKSEFTINFNLYNELYIKYKNLFEQINLLLLNEERNISKFNSIYDQTKKYGKELQKFLPEYINNFLISEINSQNEIQLNIKNCFLPLNILNIGDDFVLNEAIYSINNHNFINNYNYDKSKGSYGKKKCLFFVNTGERNELRSAINEIIEIIGNFYDSKNIIFEIFHYIDSSISKENFLNILKKNHFDILHFSSHFTFSPGNPLESFFEIFNSKSKVYVFEILNAISKAPPKLVFLNSCESAGVLKKLEKISLKNNFLTKSNKEFKTIAELFLNSGVLNFLGYQLSVDDLFSSLFSINFYKFFCDDFSFGKAISNAKQATYKEISGDANISNEDFFKNYFILNSLGIAPYGMVDSLFDDSWERIKKSIWNLSTTSINSYIKFLNLKDQKLIIPRKEYYDIHQIIIIRLFTDCNYRSHWSW